MSHGEIRAALEYSMHNLDADAAYLMRILSETTDAARVLPQLIRLLRRSNPYVRSKVVKMIGRGGHSVKWVLHEADPRVRANAIEALWRVDTPEARALLHLATNDSDNRVLGNALLGLYYLGDCAVLEQLIKLSADAPAGFRATAAWVMGQTGDLRFHDIVRGLLQDSAPTVRRRALTALTRIGRWNANLPQNPQLRIAGRILAQRRSRPNGASSPRSRQTIRKSRSS
jgi:HEAT repeat protein